MADQPTKPVAKKLKSCHQIYDESIGIRPQMDDCQPRQSEDDQQREQLGPRGVPGKPDPAKMVPQRKKKTPSDFDPATRPECEALELFVRSHFARPC